MTAAAFASRTVDYVIGLAVRVDARDGYGFERATLRAMTYCASPYCGTVGIPDVATVEYVDGSRGEVSCRDAFGAWHETYSLDMGPIRSVTSTRWDPFRNVKVRETRRVRTWTITGYGSAMGDESWQLVRSADDCSADVLDYLRRAQQGY